MTTARPKAILVETRSAGARHLSPGSTWLVCFVLVAATLAVYWPVRHFDFVNYDDQDGIVKSAAIRGGLSWSGVAWAFQNRHMGNWQPLTCLSHMLDCQLFGLRPGPPHLVNLSLHLANTVLLFLLLQQLTGARWRSAFVAALFALHPLHVESVAWVSERKDVLSTLFFLLTLWAYARYVEKAEGSNTQHATRIPPHVSRFTPSAILHPRFITSWRWSFSPLASCPSPCW